MSKQYPVKYKFLQEFLTHQTNLENQWCERQIGPRIATNIPEAATFHSGGALESRDRSGPAARPETQPVPFPLQFILDRHTISNQQQQPKRLPTFTRAISRVLLVFRIYIAQRSTTATTQPPLSRTIAAESQEKLRAIIDRVIELLASYVFFHPRFSLNLS